MFVRIGTALCVGGAICLLPVLPASAAPGPWAPPPVNSCKETGFDPMLRQPDPKAPPAPVLPPLPRRIDIPIPYPDVKIVPQYGPPQDNTRFDPGKPPANPCEDPCPDLTDDKKADPPAPGPFGSSGSSDGSSSGSGSGSSPFPEIHIDPRGESIPIPVPGGPPPPPQPAPAPAIHPAEPGPVTPPVPAPHVGNVRMAGQMTGHGSENRTDKRYQVDGTDLGITWESKPGEISVAFGDTFGKGWQYGVAGGPDWRSNVLGHSTDHDLKDGMKIDSMVQDKRCHAAELLDSRKIDRYEMTTIPTSGFAIGNRQYMSYMSVQRWSVVPGMWFTNYGGIAYSDDDGQTWTKDQHAKWENIFGMGKFQVAAMVPHGDYVYMFGTPNGRIGMIGLARVPKDQVLNTTAYQYWVNGTWAPSAENDATPIASGIAAELSARFDEKSKLWQLSYLDPSTGTIVLRNSSSPQGIWSTGSPLLNTADYPKAYGGFIHPWSTDKDLYFSISAWDSYNVYLMHADLN